ncbi:MAG: cupin domain-containing protein [Planctomycetes bacterium]|nr:cupin domain-containing protein [Planctomycetota bacterium]
MKGFGFAALVLIAAGCVTADRPPDPSGRWRYVFDDGDVPWEDIGGGMRRKVFFSDRMTLAAIEAAGPTAGPIRLHSHPNEQIAYVIDGDIEVQVGGETRRVAAGGFYRVPPDVPHGIILHSPSARIIDAFTPPREDFRKR